MTITIIATTHSRDGVWLIEYSNAPSLRTRQPLSKELLRAGQPLSQESRDTGMKIPKVSKEES